MRRLIVAALVSAATLQPVAFAQELPLDVIGEPAASVRELLKHFREAPKVSQASKDALEAFVRSLTVVFVPGILGSEIRSSGEKVWPKVPPSPEQLALAPALINENMPSDSDPRVSDDIYGSALAAFRERLKPHGIPFITCGYDWRRDIRAGAADLERCLARELPEERQRNLVLVAHSMGGLVIWVWNQDHEGGRFSPKHKVAAIVILGTPLKGSCEILRMVQSGYVQPTDYTGYSDSGSVLDRIGSFFNRKVREIENALTSLFSQSLRPVVLSWPGALELAPAAVSDTSPCVSAAFTGPGSEATLPPSHFKSEFWRTPPGNDFLSGIDAAALPSSLEQVLEKAANFRDRFSPSRPRAPAFLYFSGLWVTPEHAAMASDGHLSTRPWYAIEGDGRVPMESATASQNWAETFFDAYGTKSVHGDLPIDDDFLRDFFSRRLPKFVNALAALQAIQLMLDDAPLLEAYAAAGGKPPLAADIVQSLGNTRPATQQPEYVQVAAALTAQFRTAYCVKRPCADYKEARAAQDKGTPLAAAGLFTESLAALPTDSPHAVLAMGNRGMELAKAGKWQSAAVALGQTVENFKNLPESFDRDPNRIRRFKDVVLANYGRALAMVGRCEEAAPVLKEAKDRNRFALDSWRSACVQRDSGLLRPPLAR